MPMFTDVKKIKTFVAIVEEGSFTGAADRINMAQPWVSVQLKQLEEMLDLTLVERSKGKLVKLSPSGREFFPIAKKLLASCAEATEEIRALRNRDRGKLVLGVDPITLYIPERNELIRRFMTQFQDTELQLVSRTPTELFDGLRSGEFDLILTSSPSPDEEEIEVLPLYEYDLRLLVPKSSAKTYERSINGNIAEAQILTLPDSYHPPMFSWLKSALAPWDVRWMECPESSFQALIRYSAMLGIATLSPDLSESIPEMRNEMEICPVRDTPLKVRWGLMRRAGYRKKAPESFWRMAAKSPLLERAA
jgi:DNA-binding transcriptional LysR family regulator